MVSAVNSIGQNPIDRETLEVIRRLQSLGIRPSGNITVDRQRLQQAEFQKKQATLATNSEQNLNKISGTEADFSSALNSINKQLPAVIENKDTNNIKSIGLVKGDEVMALSGAQISTYNRAIDDDKVSPYNMVGATQLAELNKIRLGLIA